MKLTPEETELILSKRKEADENTPKKVGFLKADLFYIESRYPEIRHNIQDIVKNCGWWCTKEVMLDIIERIKFELLSGLAAKAGTQFDCYIVDGEELWYDSEGIGIEEMDAAWAARNLKDIKELK